MTAKFRGAWSAAKVGVVPALLSPAMSGWGFLWRAEVAYRCRLHTTQYVEFGHGFPCTGT